MCKKHILQSQAPFYKTWQSRAIMVIRPNVFLGGVSIAYLGLLWCQAYQSQEELIKLYPENLDILSPIKYEVKLCTHWDGISCRF